MNEEIIKISQNTWKFVTLITEMDIRICNYKYVFFYFLASNDL